MSKKILICALAAAAAIGTTSAAYAFDTTGSGFYIGGDLGYGNTNWKDFDSNVSLSVDGTVLYSDTINFKGDGVAGRLYTGYDINRFLGVETGVTFFPRTDMKENITDYFNGNSSSEEKFDTYGFDLLGKITVPVCNQLGLFAKAGPGYLHYNFSDVSGNSGVDLVYGFGANYYITPNVIANASFLRYSGDYNSHSSDQHPNADLYGLGLSYKFAV